MPKSKVNETPDITWSSIASWLSTSAQSSSGSQVASQLLSGHNAMLDYLDKALDETDKMLTDGVDICALIPSHDKHIHDFIQQISDMVNAEAPPDEESEAMRKFNKQMQKLLENPVVGPMLEAYIVRFTARTEKLLTNASYQYGADGVRHLADMMGLTERVASVATSAVSSVNPTAALQQPFTTLATLTIPGAGFFVYPYMLTSFCATLVDQTDGAVYRWLSDTINDPLRGQQLAKMVKEKYFERAIENTKLYLEHLDYILDSGAASKSRPQAEQGTWSSALQTFLTYSRSYFVSKLPEDLRSEYEKLTEVRATLKVKLGKLEKKRSDFNREYDSTSNAFLQKSIARSVKSFLTDVEVPLKTFISKQGCSESKFDKVWQFMTRDKKRSKGVKLSALSDAENSIGSGLRQSLVMLTPTTVKRALSWSSSLLHRSLGLAAGLAASYQVQSQLQSRRQDVCKALRQKRQQALVQDKTSNTTALAIAALTDKKAAKDFAKSALFHQTAQSETLLENCGTAAADRTLSAINKLLPFDLLALEHLDYWTMARDLSRDLLYLGAGAVVAYGAYECASSALGEFGNLDLTGAGAHPPCPDVMNGSAAIDGATELNWGEGFTLFQPEPGMLGIGSAGAQNVTRLGMLSP